MPVLHVRHVPEDLYASPRERERPRAQGRSLSSEVILFLEAGRRRHRECPADPVYNPRHEDGMTRTEARATARSRM
jgi:hypothetical protein